MKQKITKKCSLAMFLLLLSSLFLNCSSEDPITLPPDPEEQGEEEEEEVEEGPAPKTMEVVPSDVTITQLARKLEQLVGETDRHRGQLTRSQTYSRYGLEATDLGVPFQKGDTTFVLFGDTWGNRGGLPNTIAYTTDINPEDGLKLDFVQDQNGSYHPLSVSQISQNEYEVPTEGIMVNDQMYIYHTTDHSTQVAMGRSIVARSNNNGGRTFSFLYNLSTDKFINVSVVQDETAAWPGLPSEENQDALITFGSGTYRASKVYLAYQPAIGIENPQTIRYFAGVDEKEEPVWKNKEAAAAPLFDMDTDCVGEFSVSYNKFIKKWILLYNCGNPRGINLRTADMPWGPWTEPQVIYEPWNDGGYCNYIHVNWQVQNCDNVHDPGRQNEYGGEYGPYQFEHFATGDDQTTTIYFTLSTWNPYTVLLMQARLSL